VPVPFPGIPFGLIVKEIVAEAPAAILIVPDAAVLLLMV
jgi:hypothetical protein